MNNINPIIMDALSKNNNMVTTSQVQKLGFSKQTLNNYVKAGLLERIRQGVYIIPDAVHTDLYGGGDKDYIPFNKLESFFKENLK